MDNDGRLAAVLALFGVVVGTFLYYIGAFGALWRRGEFDTKDDWTRISSSPDGEHQYPPQGMTVEDGDLLVTNHWNGAKSGLYRVDSETGDILARAAMPAEAKHTSGLAWDGEWLWALDHESNMLYQLNIEETFAEEQAVVERQFETGLQGASGLTLIEAGDKAYFVISDFLWTIETTPSLPVGSARTYIVPRTRVERGKTVEQAAVCSYNNGGYSQGITWDGSYLYESLNNLGTDRIEVLDVSDILSDPDTGNIDRIGSFEGPAGRIEDLGTDGDTLWTTDEGTYALYRLDSLGYIRESLSG